MTSHASVQIRETVQANAAAAGQSRVQAAGRLLYVDNLRVFLTILVLAHHLAITYGADGGWYYYERPSTELAGILLTMFTALNQFYFMGLFFLIAGYFVPGSVDRKGAGQFIKDRLVRLGIPLVLFTLLVSPFLIYINGLYEGWYTGSLRNFLAGYRENVGFESGPLWFAEALLVFSTVYVLGRLVMTWLKNKADTKESLPQPKPLTHARILALILILAPVNVITRLFFPIGETWHNWQLAFFPQYVFLFAAGIFAYRNGWLEGISNRVRKTWSTVAIVAMVSFPLGMLSIALGGSENLDAVKSGLSPLSIFVSTFEAVYCVSMPVLMFSIFRRRFAGQGPLNGFLSRNAFTAYILHAPIMVLAALMFREVELDPLLKFVLVAPLGITLTFLASSLARRLPLADRVL